MLSGGDGVFLRGFLHDLGIGGVIVGFHHGDRRSSRALAFSRRTTSSSAPAHGNHPSSESTLLSSIPLPWSLPTHFGRGTKHTRAGRRPPWLCL